MSALLVIVLIASATIAGVWAAQHEEAAAPL